MFKSFFYMFLLSLTLFLVSCSKIRESAGVTRKQIDEFQAIENPPLVIPPDFSLVPPDQLKQKNIDDIEKELAKEILFGLEENKENSKEQISTMSKILSESDADSASNDIRTQIDNDFAKEKKTSDIINLTWEDEVEVLDAIAESERIRNSNFEGTSISEGDVPVKKEKAKDKKKKRFIFF